MAKKIRATDDTMGKLHEKVAEVLMHSLDDLEKLTPQMLAQAIKFLANNKVQGEEMGALDDKAKKASQVILPQFEDEEY